MTRSLKNDGGAYSVIETVRGLLRGWTVPGVSDATRLTAGNDELRDKDASKWLYSIAFTFNAPEVVA
jgi:hypothetical protein